MGRPDHEGGRATLDRLGLVLLRQSGVRSDAAPFLLSRSWEDSPVIVMRASNIEHSSSSIGALVQWEGSVRLGRDPPCPPHLKKTPCYSVHVSPCSWETSFSHCRSCTACSQATTSARRSERHGHLSSASAEGPGALTKFILLLMRYFRKTHDVSPTAYPYDVEAEESRSAR